MKTIKTIVRLNSACVALAACCSIAACNKAPAPAPEKPHAEGDTVVFPADSTQTKALTTVNAAISTKETLTLSGRVVWDETRTVRIFAPLGGRVIKLVAQPGDHVKANDALATLTSPDFGEAQAEAAKAAADFGVAQKALDRARQLHDAGVIADKDMQQADADYERAAAERSRTAARARAWGSSKNAGDNVDQQFTLRTPLAGIVVERHVNPGQEVRPDQDAPLFVVSDPDHLWVNLDLSETGISAVKPGMKVLLRAASLGDTGKEATIFHVADFIDPETRRTLARAVVDNSDHRLKAEMFVNVDVVIDRGEFIGVPDNAVILLGKTQYVFIEESPGHYRRQTVVADASGFGNMRIRQGVKPGEKIVTDGALLLQQVIATASGK